MSKRQSSPDQSERYKFFKRGSSDTDGPELYSIIQGEVASIKDYGVFVKIGGSKKQGLVHISQMCQSRVEKPAEIVDLNEKVWCKVISLENDKIGLSMKVVSQGTGEDLDPNLVQNSQDAQKRKPGFKREIPKIELGAILDTVCKKCGCKGHFAKDCFMSSGGKKYDLVTEEDLEANEINVEQKEDKKKHKSKKKKHKHKSNSDSDDNKHSHKKKKHKKHKRKHSC